MGEGGEDTLWGGAGSGVGGGSGCWRGVEGSKTRGGDRLEYGLKKQINEKEGGGPG